MMKKVERLSDTGYIQQEKERVMKVVEHLVNTLEERGLIEPNSSEKMLFKQFLFNELFLLGDIYG